MTELTVIEPIGSTLSAQIQHAVDEYCRDVCVKSAYAHTQIQDANDIIVISAGCPSPTQQIDRKYHCRALLLPDGYNANYITPHYIVTYGMCPKNTLTLSSIGEQNSVLALQRELPTVSGTIIERQELKIRSAGSIDESLALSGVLLLLGFISLL